MAPGARGAIAAATAASASCASWSLGVTAAILSNNRRYAPFGLQGGNRGRWAAIMLSARTAASSRWARRTALTCKPEISLVVETPGGGGFRRNLTVPNSFRGDTGGVRCVNILRLRRAANLRHVPQPVSRAQLNKGEWNMLNKKFAAMLAGVSVAWFAMAAPASAHSDKELVVGDRHGVRSFEFKQGNTYTGFDVDLWAAIAKQLKLKYKLQPMDFNGIIPGLQTNNIDAALAGITIRDDRKQVIDFSDPYYESGLSILVNENNTTIKRPADLAGKTVAVKTGTATVDYMQKKRPLRQAQAVPQYRQRLPGIGYGSRGCGGS